MGHYHYDCHYQLHSWLSRFYGLQRLKHCRNSMYLTNYDSGSISSRANMWHQASLVAAINRALISSSTRLARGKKYKNGNYRAPMLGLRAIEARNAIALPN